MADEGVTGPVSGISRSGALRPVRDSRQRQRPPKGPQEEEASRDDAPPDALEGPGEAGSGKRKGRFIDERI